jgi:anti-sigma factor RsiW
MALNEKEREDLVAYLDGELPEEAARSLEAKLHLDAQARAEANLLRQTWDLLDFLPRPELSVGFTHRTLERLAPVGTSGMRASAGPGRGKRGLLGLGWAAALVLAAVGGYAGFQLLAPAGPTEEDLVRDLRLIENKPLYDLVGDVEFLEALDQPALFGEENPGS